MIAYEQQLAASPLWALQEGSMHFERESAVFKTLTKIARRLDELKIPYAIAGGMAMFLHGYRRFTEDVDILVTPAGLTKIHAELDGLGYVRPFEASKNLRDAEQGVRIEFLVAGQYPGDGKPKPISFPDPNDVAVDVDGVKVVSLERLIELKLASGTAAHRLKDLADVQEMIKTLHLARDVSQRLDESVRDSYLDLWDRSQISTDE